MHWKVTAQELLHAVGDCKISRSLTPTPVNKALYDDIFHSSRELSPKAIKKSTSESILFLTQYFWNRKSLFQQQNFTTTIIEEIDLWILFSPVRRSLAQIVFYRTIHPNTSLIRRVVFWYARMKTITFVWIGRFNIHWSQHGVSFSGHSKKYVLWLYNRDFIQRAPLDQTRRRLHIIFWQLRSF